MVSLLGRLVLIQDVSYGSPIYLVFLAELTEGLLVEYILNPELLLESCFDPPLSTPLLPAPITGICLDAS